MLCRQKDKEVLLARVGFLSNLFSRSRPPDAPLEIAPVRPGQVNEAATSLLSLPGEPAHTAQLITFMQSARARGMDLMQMRVATRGAAVSYAVLPSLLPGRTLMLICGSPQSPQQYQDAAVLVRRVTEEYLNQDLSLMQALIDPRDDALAGIFRDCGFSRLAELIYLEAAARKQTWQMPEGFELHTYSPERHTDFVRAIEASYEQNLDCPGISGARNMDDVMAGHRAAGEFDPANWLVVKRNGEAAAVLLLSKILGGDALELVYIGLAVSARGRGLSDELLKLALTRAQELSCRRLTTAVDAHNTPAMRMYFRAGMQRIGSRLAMVRVIHGAVSASSTIRQQNV